MLAAPVQYRPPAFGVVEVRGTHRIIRVDIYEDANFKNFTARVSRPPPPPRRFVA
jgi:hypothetical protein